MFGGQYQTALANKFRLMAERLAKKRWHDQPIAEKPLAGREEYHRLWQDAKSKSHEEIDALETNLGDRIDADWLHDLALHTQVTIKASDICYQHGRVLYSVLRNYIRQTTAKNGSADLNIFETGTARGFSSACMAKALDDHNCRGRIVTFDLLPHDVPLYWNCIDDLDGKKSRRSLLSPWTDLIDDRVVFVEGDTRLTLANVKLGRIHFAFLDGGHTYEHVLREARTIAPQQQTGDVIVFDDYSNDSFSGLVRAVDTFCRDDNYDGQVVRASAARGFMIARKR